MISCSRYIYMEHTFVAWKSLCAVRSFSRYAISSNHTFLLLVISKISEGTGTEIETTGWYNNCASWSGYYSRGPERAFLDVNMKQTIESHIFTFYLPITGASLFIQLSLAGFIIWLNWEVIEFTVWNDKANCNYIKDGEATDQSSASLLGNQQGSSRHEGNEEMELEYMADRPSAALVRNQHGFHRSHLNRGVCLMRKSGTSRQIGSK